MARTSRWDSSPLHVLRRDLDALPLPHEQHRHLRLWMDSLMERVPDLNDLARQTEARSLVTTYIGVVQAQAKALRCKPGSREAETAWSLCMKLQDHLRKCLRTLGLKTATKQGGRKHGEAGGFAPPRDRRPSELEAERLGFDSDDSAP